MLPVPDRSVFQSPMPPPDRSPEKENNEASNTPESPLLSDPFAQLALAKPAQPKFSDSGHAEKKDKLIQAIKDIGRGFHGLTDDQIKAIAYEITDNTYEDNSQSEEIQRTDKNPPFLPRTVVYQNDEKLAHVFLKTKGHLPESLGGFRRGTRSLTISLETFEAVHSFQLVSHDHKRNSKIAFRKPFEIRVVTLLSAEEYAKISHLFAECCTHFLYTKIKKETNERIPKTCLIVPYCPHTLHDLLQPGQSRRITTADEKLRVISDIAYAIMLLHRAGIIHGDITTKNITIDQDGQPKLIDYDFAFMDKREQPLWWPGFYATRKYSAPELLEQRALDAPAADVFAFGCTIQEIRSSESFPWIDTIKQYCASLPQTKLDDTEEKRAISKGILEQALSEQRMIKPLADKAAGMIGQPIDKELLIKNLSFFGAYPDTKGRLTAKHLFLLIKSENNTKLLDSLE